MVPAASTSPLAKFSTACICACVGQCVKNGRGRPSKGHATRMNEGTCLLNGREEAVWKLVPPSRDTSRRWIPPSPCSSRPDADKADALDPPAAESLSRGTHRHHPAPTSGSRPDADRAGPPPAAADRGSTPPPRAATASSACSLVLRCFSLSSARFTLRSCRERPTERKPVSLKQFGYATARFSVRGSLAGMHGAGLRLGLRPISER